MRTSFLSRSSFAFTVTCICRRNNIDDFSKILSQARNAPSQNLFDGNFTGGDKFINPTALSDMASLRAHITPEMETSVQSMMNSLKSGQGMPAGFGMMAFGVGENERGKKVARAAKVSFDANTGKVEKDFQETQLDPDDLNLPKETVENYDTEGAMEVTFVEDQRHVESGTMEDTGREACK